MGTEFFLRLGANFTELAYEYVKWIELNRDRVQW